MLRRAPTGIFEKSPGTTLRELAEELVENTFSKSWGSPWRNFQCNFNENYWTLSLFVERIYFQSAEITRGRSSGVGTRRVPEANTREISLSIPRKIVGRILAKYSEKNGESVKERLGISLEKYSRKNLWRKALETFSR